MTSPEKHSNDGPNSFLSRKLWRKTGKRVWLKEDKLYVGGKPYDSACVYEEVVLRGNLGQLDPKGAQSNVPVNRGDEGRLFTRENI